MATPLAYVSCALHDDSSIQRADMLARLIARAGWNAYLPHRDTATPGDDTTAEIVFHKNEAALLRADAIVAEATEGAIGVGIEVATAWHTGKPLILACERTKYISKMVLALDNLRMVLRYDSEADLASLLCSALCRMADEMTRSPRQGRFIVFEGLDGAGKSEAAKGVVAHMGDKAVMVSDPPNCAPWATMKTMFEHDERINRTAEALILLASRVDSTARQVRAALDAGKNVIADRYYPSWLAYQEVRLVHDLGKPERSRQFLMKVQQIVECYGLVLRPDAVLFFTADAKVRAERRGTRGVASKYDERRVQASVEETYRRVIDELGIPVIQLNTTSLSKDDVVRHALAAIQQAVHVSQP